MQLRKKKKNTCKGLACVFVIKQTKRRLSLPYRNDILQTWFLEQPAGKSDSFLFDPELDHATEKKSPSWKTVAMAHSFLVLLFL